MVMLVHKDFSPPISLPHSVSARLPLERDAVPAPARLRIE